MSKCCLATVDGIGSKLLKSPSWADTRQREWRAEIRHRGEIIFRELRAPAQTGAGPGMRGTMVDHYQGWSSALGKISKK